MSGDTASPREVYVLRDPRTNLAHYVGTAIDSRTRLVHHLARRNHPISPWLAELREAGLKPVLQVVWTGVPWAERHGHERQWIEAFVEEGHPLLNRYMNPTYQRPAPYGYPSWSAWYQRPVGGRAARSTAAPTGAGR